MFKWNLDEMTLFKTLAQATQPALMKSMKNYLKKYYPEDKVKVCKDNFIFCEGDIPIMVVAHMDTVFKAPPKRIFYDQEQYTMWSPQGLGADDRAGVFLIWKLVHDGFLPHICLTTDEEVGGIGAQIFVNYFPKAPVNCKYIIELDRQGSNDCVFYGCANSEFQDYVEHFGFITDWGTFSDISIIAPTWGIAAVNLSVGYKNEHSEIETLNAKAMYNTYFQVCKMLKDAKNVKHFEYIPDPYEKYYSSFGKAYGWNFYPEEDEVILPKKYTCCKCKKQYTLDDIFCVKTKTSKKKFYCLDCINDKINWCDLCHEPFEMTSSDDILCEECKKKVKNEV